MDIPKGLLKIISSKKRNYLNKFYSPNFFFLSSLNLSNNSNLYFFGRNNSSTHLNIFATRAFNYHSTMIILNCNETNFLTSIRNCISFCKFFLFHIKRNEGRHK